MNARHLAEPDAAALAMFREWIDRMRVAQAIEDDDEFDLALDGIDELKERIASIPAESGAGFAIKVYMHLRCAHGSPPGGDLAGLAALDGDGTFYDRCFAAIMRDAAQFVPEIAQLAVLVIGEQPPAEIGFGAYEGDRDGAAGGAP